MPRLNPNCPAIPHSRLAQWRADAEPDPATLERLGAVEGNGRRLAVVGGNIATRRASLAQWIGTADWQGLLAVTAATSWGPDSRADVLLYDVLSQLRCGLREPQGLPTADEDLIEALPGWLARAGAGTGAVLLLDGADALRQWPPETVPRYLPPRVTMVLGVPPGPVAEMLVAQGWESVPCGDDPARDTRSDDEPALISALRLAPHGLEGSLLDALDPDGACRGAWRTRLRRCAGGVRLVPETAADEPHDDRIATDIRDAVRLAEPSLDGAELLATTGAVRDAEALLADPTLPGSDHAGIPLLAALWRYTPLPDVGLRRLGANLPPPEDDAKEHCLRLIDLASALGQSGYADEMHQDLLAAAERLPAATASEVLRREGERALESGDTARARPLFEDALSRARQAGAMARGMAAEHGLATTLETAGDLAGAESLYQAALSHVSARHGPRSGRLVPALLNLAAVQRADNRLESAHEHFTRALGIAEATLGADHPVTIGVHDNLGGLRYGGGDLEAAEHHYREAAARAERAFGDGHTATAACCHNLGTLLDARAQYREAEVWLRHALATRRHHHGDQHTDTASTLHNLAGVLDVTGRGHEAETAYREALAAWQALVGEGHPATATSRNNLADLLRERGEFEEAESLYRQNMETWRELYGAGHPNTLMTAAELGGLLSETGRHHDAEGLLRDAVSGLTEQLGATASLTVDAVLRLATLWRQTSRPRDALELMNRTLAHSEGQVGSLSPHLQKLRRHRDALRGGLQ